MKKTLLLLAYFLLFSISCFAATPSSPEEIAATAKLNTDIAAANARADARYQALRSDYEKQKAQNDALQNKYTRDKQDNDRQQREYLEQLKSYRAAYPVLPAAKP